LVVMRVRFGILGPLDAYHQGLPVDVGPRRQQLMLATLLLDAGRVVPVDRLIHSVWGERVPATARTQIHACVSALRRVLPDGVIRTRPAGYLVAPTPDELDALAFEGALDDARAAATDPADAVRHLRRALALWRGQALAGLDGPVIGPGITLLEERRLLAWEELAEHELALGRHRRLVPELSALVAQEPTRERLVATAMLALHRTGRQAEALALFRRTWRTMVDDHGLEPGAQLRRLEERILADDPELTGSAAAVGQPGSAAAARPAAMAQPAVVRLAPASASAPPVGPGPARTCQLPPAVADFTGRASALDAAHGMLTARRRHVVVVAISGPAGVGKSSFALQLAHRLRNEFPDWQIYADLGGLPPTAMDPLHLLGRLLRAAGIPDTEQADELAERAVQLRETVADRRVLLVLDDASSAAQIRPVLPGTSSCAVIVTSRRQLSELEAAVHLPLSALDPEEARTLLARIAGTDRVAAEPAAAAEIVSLCGSLPLAIRIAGAKLAARRHWRLARLADRLRDEFGRLDELRNGDLAVRASLALSYRALPEPTRRLFRLLSLLEAADLPVRVGAALLDVSDSEAEEHLELLVDACLVNATHGPGDAVRYTMHDLPRLFAQEQCANEDDEHTRRTALTRAFGAWLSRAEQAADASAAQSLAVIRGEAPRWPGPSSEQPGPGGPLVRPALDPAVAARGADPGTAAHGADPAVASREPDPGDWFEQERTAVPALIRQACELDMAGFAWNLAAATQAFYELRGCYDEARQTHELALRACRRVGDQLGEAVMHRNLADLWVARPGADRRDRLRAAESALRLFRLVGEAAGIADALWLCADERRINGQHGEAAALLEQALAVATQARYELGECRVLSQLAMIARERGDGPATLRLGMRYLELARKLGLGRQESVALSLIGLAYRILGDFVRSQEQLAEAVTVARRLGDPAQETFSLARLGQCHAACGDDRARPVLREALARSRAAELTFGEALSLMGLAELALVEGRPRAALWSLHRALRLLGTDQRSFVRAQALTALGRAFAGLGEAAEAATAWSAAYGLWRQIDNDVAATEVSALLTALETPLNAE
jgi:DNA-binding SARP family transcriptional activator/tetratricopeptide (TPR) repeat protein